VAWSLSDEAFFYLLFPFLRKRFLKISLPGLAGLALACWAVSVAMSWTYVLRNPDHLQVIDADVLNAFWLNAVKFHPFARLPEFLLGMACGAMFLKSRKDAKPGSSEKLALPLVLAGLAIAATVAHFSARIPYTVLHTSLLAPAFAAIIFGFALQPRWGSPLNWKPLVFLGDASYSLYLLHSFFLGPFFFTQTGAPRHRGPGWYSFISCSRWESQDWRIGLLKSRRAANCVVNRHAPRLPVRRQWRPADTLGQFQMPALAERFSGLSRLVGKRWVLRT
jgi:peptidoglycan/LPS O-acetylase OafA/YrhL